MVIQPAIAAEIVDKVTKICGKYNTHVWIEFGTLLGHIRDGGIMPHDRDMDFGLEYSTWDDCVLEEFLDTGFIIRNSSIFSDDRPLKFVGSEKRSKLTNLMPGYKGVNIGFEIYHEGMGDFEDYMYFWPPRHPNWIFEIPKRLVVPQIKTTFCNTLTWMPENFMDNIKFMYGESWQTPIAGYTGGKIHRENSKRFRRYFK
jgi:phosphorylcholine metabolism protein LicD